MRALGGQLPAAAGPRQEGAFVVGVCEHLNGSPNADATEALFS